MKKRSLLLASAALAVAGMSAAAVISPMLITFLDIDPYMAVGIALSSDVLASAVSAYTYHKNKNLDIKNCLIDKICTKINYNTMTMLFLTSDITLEMKILGLTLVRQRMSCIDCRE